MASKSTSICTKKILEVSGIQDNKKAQQSFISIKNTNSRMLRKPFHPFRMARKEQKYYKIQIFKYIYQVTIFVVFFMDNIVNLLFSSQSTHIIVVLHKILITKAFIQIFFFCLTIYYTVLDCSLWQTINSKQLIMFCLRRQKLSLQVEKYYQS